MESSSELGGRGHGRVSIKSVQHYHDDATMPTTQLRRTRRVSSSARLTARANAHDVYRTSRLQAFNDAVMAIVCTIGIIPMKISADVPEGHLREYLYQYYRNFVVFFLTFFVAANVWTCHIQLFRALRRLDDVIIWLNSLSLLLIAFLPVACTLMARYPYSVFSVGVMCTNVTIVSLCQLAMLLYSWRNGEVLGTRRLGGTRFFSMLAVLVNPIACAAVMVACIFSMDVAWGILSLFIIAPYIVHFVEWRLGRRGTVRSLKSQMRDDEAIKERVQCFTDGVYSIVATLIILDIPPRLPSPSTVPISDLPNAVLSNWHDYISFVGSFAIAGLLWFVHHSLFQHLRRVTPLSMLLNNMGLAFVGLIPFMTSLLTRFANHHDRGEVVAVQFGTIVMMGAGLFQICVWLRAMRDRSDLLDASAQRKRVRVLILLKTLIIPVVSVVTLVASFASYEVGFFVYHVSLGALPVAFLILKASYSCWQRNKNNVEYTHPMEAGDDSNSEDSGEEGNHSDGTGY